MTIAEILGMFGLTGEIAEAVTKAEVSPSGQNIKAVIAAYARNGQTPPAKLMAHLVARNREEFPNDPFITETIGTAAKWVLGGAILLWLFFKK